MFYTDVKDHAPSADYDGALIWVATLLLES